MVPNIFEPDLCRRLIDLYEADGGEESGFMRDVDGKTQLLLDPTHKVRRDYLVEDEELAPDAQPEARCTGWCRWSSRAFQFKATRVERLIVACYEAESGGHFRAAPRQHDAAAPPTAASR